MKIVVLDADPALGSAAAPEESRGALSFSELEALGQVEIHSSTAQAEVIERLRGAQVALTNKVPLTREVFQALPELKLVSVLATGVNVIDLDAAREQSVTVCNVPGYSTASTAQHTFALLLELCHSVGAHSSDVRSGNWQTCPSFSYWKHPLVELDGKTLGVVGFGAIGQRVVAIAQAFGMRVLVHTRTERATPGLRFVNKQTLLAESDVISLHCPLTPETRHFIDAPALKQVRQGAFLLNVARGPIIDEAAVAAALDSGRLGAAAVDVLSVEPPSKANPLAEHPRCLVTPHVAWATMSARQRLVNISEQNVRGFLEGKPQNVVS